jgi:hypothetical protein
MDGKKIKEDKAVGFSEKFLPHFPLTPFMFFVNGFFNLIL